MTQIEYYYNKKLIESLKEETPFSHITAFNGRGRKPAEPDHVCPECGHGFDCDREYE